MALSTTPAVLITQPSGNISSYHFRVVVILIAEIVIVTEILSFVGFPILERKGILKTVAAAP